MLGQQSQTEFNSGRWHALNKILSVSAGVPATCALSPGNRCMGHTLFCMCPMGFLCLACQTVQARYSFDRAPSGSQTSFLCISALDPCFLCRALQMLQCLSVEREWLCACCRHQQSLWRPSAIGMPCTHSGLEPGC